MGEFRLGLDTSVKWVWLTVSNLEDSLRFYAGLLGLSHISWLGDKVVLGSGENNPLMILSEKKDALPKPKKALGLYHYAVLVPSRRDLARMFVRLAKGWQFEGASDHLVSEALYLRDPDRHGIEIYADRQRTEWPTYGNRFIRMATLPLNINSLLQELREEGTELALSSEWTIPRQTRLGHIHLHVSSLEKAEKFYHQILGFDITYRLGRSVVFFSAGGYHHHIVANIWAGVDAQPLSGEYVRLESFAIGFGDRRTVSELRARLLENGLAVEDSLQNELGNYVGFTTWDYDGTAVEIVTGQA